jgi:putative ABC transport system permease protein
MSFGTLAIKTLLADRGKFAAALVGVVFSVVLVNIQGGLFLGLIRKAGMLVDNSQADIWVGHKHMHNVDFPRDIPRRWLHRIRGISGVQEAIPYLVGFSDMTLPSGNFESVVIVGVPPHSSLGRPWNMRAGTLPFGRPYAIVIDACDRDKLEGVKLGDLREIGGRRARVAGESDGVLSFLVAPYVFTNYDEALKFLGKDPNLCSYFLVKVSPGEVPEQVCQKIMRQTPELDALPSARYSQISQDFWLTRTGIGLSFGAATLMGLLVGLVMVAQTLYASVIDRISEFAALKAMGAADRQIFWLLGIQAIFMAVVGTLLGLGAVAALQWMASTPRASIEIPFWLSAGSFVLVLFICVLAALLPYERVRKIDPLSVLQGG